IGSYPSPSTTRIGYTWIHAFNGSVDEVGVFNTALTAAQVADLYTRGAAQTKYQVRVGTANPPTAAWTGSNGPSTTKSLGLVSFWKFEDGTGQSAGDSKGSTALTLGALTDAGADDPTWTTSGKVGGALSFDGTADFLKGSDAGFPTGANPKTIAMWVKPSAIGGNRVALDSGAGGATQALEIYMNTSNLWIVTQNGASLSGHAAVQDQWSHLVVTYDGSTYVIYGDGARTAAGAMTTSTVAGGTLYIGQQRDNTLRYSGLMDEIALYNRALTGKEVWELYRSYDYVENLGTDFLHGLLKQRYLQYRTLFDTLSETLAPDVTKIAVDMSSYAVDNPTIVPATGQAFTYLTSFAETVTTPAGSAMKYVLSPNNGTYWYYHNGTNWVSSDGTYAQAATAATIHTNIAGFEDKAYADGYLPENSTGTLKVKAFLNSDGAVTPTLDALAVGYESGTITVTAPNGSESWPAATSQNITWSTTGVAPGDLTLEYTKDGTNYTSIATGEANDGTYAWTVPTDLNSTSKVRIRSAGVPAIRDLSNANFSIVANLAVGAPNGAEQWQVGVAKNITWTGSSLPNDLVIEYTKDGTNYTSIATAVNGTSGTPYSWTVPDDPSATVKIRIRSAGTTGIADSSDANFKISKLTMTAPNGTESWPIGTTQTITWAKDTLITNVKLDYTTDGTNYTTIIASTSNTGSYSWAIPANLTASSTVKVRVTGVDAGYDQITDLSNANFSLTGPLLSVTAPIATDVWPVTSTKTIKWAVNGPIPSGGTVKLSYSADNGSTWTAVASADTLDATAGATGFAWPVPLNAASGTAKIKVEANPAWSPNNAVAGISAAYKVAANVTVIAPNGGEKWAVGAPHTVSWQTQGTVADVKLEYSKDSGSTWTTILASTTNDGSEAWTPVAADAGATVIVRVSSTSDADANDVSNASFKVSTVAVTAPTASGVRWLAGSSQSLTWTSTAVTNVKLEYSTAGVGGPWTTIIATTPAAGGALSWTVANKTTTTAFIRLSDADPAPAANGTDTALATDNSDNAFAIYGTLDVTAPDTASLEWAAGQPQTITWTTSPADANVVPNVKIEVTDLINSANNQVLVASTGGHNVAAGSGSYAWSPTFTTSSAKITVTDVGDALVTNTAANAFSLTGVSLSAPTGGESWTVGTQQQITLSFTGTMTIAKVEYSKDNGSTYALAAAGSLQTSTNGTTWTAYAADGTAVPVTANPFYLKWTVADAISSVNQAKIRVTNPATAANAVSAGFTITGTLAMTTPSGVLSVGDVATLSWAKVGTIGSVKVEFKPDGDFTTGTPAVVGTALTGTSTSWTVPDNIGTTGKLRVTDTVTGHPVITGTSNAFSIKGKLAFTAPVTTTTWPVGTSQTVTWTTNGTIGPVKLQYATAADNYVSWTDLAGAASIANTGTYTWNPLPDIVGGTVNPPSPIASPTNGTRAVKLRITDLTTGHTGAIQEIIDSAAFTGKWYLVTYNVQNQDASYLASLNVTDSETWNVTDGSLTSPSQTKRHYKHGAITGTWSKPQFTAATVNFTADTDKTITAVLESETPTVFDVKFESFYDATTDTVKAKAFLFRRGLLINDASLTAATITIFDGATQKATYSDTAPDANGVFDFSFTGKDAGLTAASSFLVKVAITYSGQVKTGAGTLNITLPSETKSIINLTGTAADAAAASTLFGKLAGVKSDILAQMGSINDAAAANSLFGRLKNLDKLLGATSDTGSAESVFGRLTKTQSELASKVASEAARGPQTGILNRDPVVKTGNTITLRYRTATGLTPKVDIYDPSNTKRVSAGTMTEIATTGIYEYSATFDKGWGTGDFSVVASESTKNSVDSMIMTVITTDLEAIAKKAGGSSAGGGGSAATDLSPVMAALAALRGMVTMSAGTGGLVAQVAALQQQLSSMQAQLGLVGAIEDEEADETAEAVSASTQATMSVRDQLKEIAQSLKHLSGPTGNSLHQLFEIQEAQVNTAKDLQNKIEQIKQATEVTKRIAEEGRQKVQVQTWFESGSVILKILAVNPTDEEQTVPVKAYLPKEVKAEHVMDLGSLKLEYDPDRQMHFVTATVTLKPNESAVFAIEVEDIWQIPQAALTRLSDDAKVAVKQLTGTEYEERAMMLASQIDLKLASIWEKQSDPTLTPEQHIQTYRQNIESMKRLEDDLALLKRMAVTVMNPDAPKTPESEFLNKAFSGVQSNWEEGGASPIAVSLKSHLTTDATWRLIFGMVVFVGLLSLAAFLIWQRQAHLTMTADAALLQEAAAVPGGPGPPGTGPATAPPPGTGPPGS
ncbi:MAG: hypothetical protein HY600_04475, partial [Candidatus Omnitrophica bacterium]|nr:hypothetical protein [Candidatus Omnitrophota bacterium]